MRDEFIEDFGEELFETMFFVFYGDMEHPHIKVLDSQTDSTGADGFYQRSGTMEFFGSEVSVVDGNGDGSEVTCYEDTEVENIKFRIQTYLITEHYEPQLLMESDSVTTTEYMTWEQIKEKFDVPESMNPSKQLEFREPYKFDLNLPILCEGIWSQIRKGNIIEYGSPGGITKHDMEKAVAMIYGIDPYDYEGKLVFLKEKRIAPIKPGKIVKLKGMNPDLDLSKLTFEQYKSFPNEKI